METKIKTIYSSIYPSLHLDIMPGHFATRHSHVNYYLDMTEIKCNHTMSFDAGAAFAEQLKNSTPVETIVCLDGTEIIAAYLALELCKSDNEHMMSGSSINVIIPEFNSSGQFIFRDNIQKKISNKQILIMAASATTGNTLAQAIQCAHYYNGRISSIAAVFSAVEHIDNQTVHSLFSNQDIPDYEAHLPIDCTSCKAGKRLEAIVNSYGYSKL